MEKEKTVFPKYYSRFACKAEKCTHNCCVGWEIDIDENTAKAYEGLSGDIGEKIRENTDKSGNVSHFVMKNGRCPMLCEDNLCSIIREMGEGALCDICREHPRFYTELSSVSLGGVGMSCEAAAELILSQKSPTLYGDIGYSLGANDENEFERSEAVLRALSDIESLLSSGEGALSSICNAVHRIIDLSCEIDLYLFGEVDELSEIIAETDGLLLEGRNEIPLKLGKILSELEYMSEGFVERIFAAKWRQVSEIAAENPTFGRYLLNIFAYLTARHLPQRAENGDTIGALGIILAAFSVLALLLSGDPAVLSEDPDISLLAAVRLAVLFSEEIEYSEENTERLSELLL